MNWKQATFAAAIAASLAGAAVYAQPPMEQASRTMGGGMMMDDRSPDRDDMGGTMRGGMGPGMMSADRAWGMGGGMMDGMGMMGPDLRAIGRLDLSDTQRRQVQKVDDDLRRKNWDVMGKMHDEMARMRDAMWASDKRDRAAILASNKRMSELRQQMLENALDAADRAEALLTAPQREQLRRRAQ